MKKVLLIIAQNNFRDEELLEPKKLLELNGIKCQVASITKDQAKGMLGSIVKPDLAIKDVKVSDYDMVAIIGGQGAHTLINYPEVFKILQEAKATGKYLASICLGGTVLAKSGVLNGVKSTVFSSPEAIKILKENGARYTPLDVVRDGKIITATNPKVAKQFGHALAEALLKS